MVGDSLAPDAGLEPSLSSHGVGSRCARLMVDQPRACMLRGELARIMLAAVLLGHAAIQIVRLADVPLSCRGALTNVHEVPQTSPSRARTYNLAVNSRSLYRLSYRGSSLPSPAAQREPLIRHRRTRSTELSYRGSSDRPPAGSARPSGRDRHIRSTATFLIGGPVKPPSRKAPNYPYFGTPVKH